MNFISFENQKEKKLRLELKKNLEEHKKEFDATKKRNQKKLDRRIYWEIAHYVLGISVSISSSVSLIFTLSKNPHVVVICAIISTTFSIIFTWLKPLEKKEKLDRIEIEQKSIDFDLLSLQKGLEGTDLTFYSKMLGQTLEKIKNIS